MNAITPIQASLPNSPLVDRSGNLTPAWRSWFLAIMARTGGNIGTDASGAATAAQLAAETAARAAADTSLTTAISNEAAARATAVSAEATTRAAADAYLGGAATAATTGTVALETAPAGFGTKISGMTTFDATTVTGAEVFPIVQGSANFKWPLATLYQTMLQLVEFVPNPLDAPSGSDTNGEFIEFFAGNGDLTGGGGSLVMQAGNGGATAAGGVVQFIAGSGGATSGNGGTLDFQAGDATDGIGGEITFAAGTSGGANDGGPLRFNAGPSGAGATGNGGAITFEAGVSAATDGDGGTVTFTGGTGSGTGSGGQMAFNAGGSGSGATGTGGGVGFQTGTCNATDGDGGDFTIQTGNGAGTGRTGLIVINGMAATDGAVPNSLWADNGVLVQSGATVSGAVDPLFHTPDMIGDVSLPIALTTGTTDTSASGTISATTGDGSTGAVSGDVRLTTGAGQDTGAVVMTTGTAAGTSGNVNAVTGDGDSSGSLLFGTGAATSAAGSVIFQVGLGGTAQGDIQFILSGGNLLTIGLPTADAAVTGAVWSDNGVLTQSGATLATAFAAADLSGLPIADPGGGQPWLLAGVLKVGP